jgi:hypothetical protein
MKTVIVTMPMTARTPERFKYPVQGNRELEYDGEVAYPVNGILARTLQAGEQARLIYLVTAGGDNKGRRHSRAFRTELDAVNGAIGAEFVEETIEAPFEPTQKEFDRLIRALIDKIGDNAEIIADFTYGSKPFPFILLCALNFAEMFHNAIIQCLVYGKVDFIDGKPRNPVMFDVTSIYYLQKLIAKMEGHNPETALKMLDGFFTL